MSGRGEEILGFAALGLTDKQIAARLGVSARTVEGHWRRLREQHQQPNRSALIATLHCQPSLTPEWYQVQIDELTKKFDDAQREHARLVHRELAELHGEISTLKRAENEAEHLRSLLNKNQAIAYRLQFHAPHACLYMSDSIEAFGYSPFDFVAGRMLICNLIHPEDFSSIWSPSLRRLTQGSGQVDRTYRALTRKGEARTLFERASLELDAKGKASICSCVAFDITHTLR